MTDIKFDEHAHTRIVSYLRDCYTNITDDIDAKKLRNLNCANDALMLYDLSWMVVICQSQYSFMSINWDDKELQRNVYVLHSTFMKWMDDKIHSFTASEDLKSPSDQKMEEICCVVGIRKKEFIHDAANKGILEYWISTSLAVELFIRYQNTFEEPRNKSINNDRLKWGRYEHNKAPEDFCRLTVWYSREATQLILEEAEKGNLSLFAKVIYPDNTETFISLTPPEVTTVRNNSPDKTNIIIQDFFANIFELWVSKNTISERLGLAANIISALNESIISSTEGVKNHHISSSINKKSKSRMRAILEEFAEYLITHAICNTYPRFEELMTISHIHSGVEKMSDECKFNEHPRIKNVYCIKVKPKEGKALKKTKHSVHFSILSESGELIPQESYSLSSFKDIFDTAIKRLRNIATKTA